MVIVHVQHYLTEEGVTYFPTWLKMIAKTLRKFHGFVSLSQLTDLEDKDAQHLMMTFKTLTDLRAWVVSQQHDDMIEKLAPFRLTIQSSQIFETQHIK